MKGNSPAIHCWAMEVKKPEKSREGRLKSIYFSNMMNGMPGDDSAVPMGLSIKDDSTPPTNKLVGYYRSSRPG